MSGVCRRVGHEAIVNNGKQVIPCQPLQDTVLVGGNGCRIGMIHVETGKRADP
jgi:hypothetical protein